MPDLADDEIPEQRHRGERRHVSIAEVVSIMMLVIQFGALVWGASALKSSVDDLRVTMSETSRQSRETQSTINQLTLDVGILKDRVYKQGAPR